MYASRKLHLDPEDEDQRDEEVWTDRTGAGAIYGDYYADRKWSRQWLLPGFGFGNSTRIDRWAKKYLVKEYQRMAGGKRSSVWMAGEVKVLKVFVGSTLVYTVFAIVQVICDRGLAAHDITTWPLASELVDIVFTCIFLVEILWCALVGGFAFFLITPVALLTRPSSSRPASQPSSCSRSRACSTRRSRTRRGGPTTTLIQLMRLKMARIITTLGRAHSDEIGFGLKMISSKLSADDKAAWTDYVDFKCTTKGKVEIMIKNRGGLEELQEVDWRLRSAHRHLLALKYRRTRATVGDAGEVRGEDVWLKVDLYQFPALSRFISEKGFWTWRADAHTQLSTNLNDTICDIILAISDADEGPNRLAEPPDFLTQRDPTGATVIHALFIAASPRALKVGLKILDRWPELLSDPHKESDALIRKLGLDDKSITDKEKLKLARAWGVFCEKKKTNEDRDTWTSKELTEAEEALALRREKGREAEFTQGTFDGENVLHIVTINADEITACKLIRLAKRTSCARIRTKRGSSSARSCTARCGSFFLRPELDVYGSAPVCFMAAMGLKKPIVLLCSRASACSPARRRLAILQGSTARRRTANSPRTCSRRCTPPWARARSRWSTS